MRRTLLAGLLLVLAVGCFSLPAGAETLTLPDGLQLTFPLPEGWQFSRQAPDFLIEHTVEHVTDDLEAQGKKVDPARLRQAVLKRLAENEGFVYNPGSRSVLLIDFSPLRHGEDAPDAGTVKQSARYAAAELRNEPGASAVEADSERAHFSGLPTAYRVDATYRMHEQPRRFLGIVGFRDPYWVYLYYTDTLQNKTDLAQMEKLLEQARLVPGKAS